ncbi:hypothetical protein SUGI_0482060 [Cryptomeria japonica]|nr:hypothetical protein SUGI_0482060 [Cryptomeria japonica]
MDLNIGTALWLAACGVGPRARIWMKFPREGSQLTPPHQSVDFKWKDYCLMVFRLRFIYLKTTLSGVFCMSGLVAHVDDEEKTAQHSVEERYSSLESHSCSEREGHSNVTDGEDARNSKDMDATE